MNYQPTEDELKKPKHSGVFVYYQHEPSGRVADMPLHDWIQGQGQAKFRRNFSLIRYVKPNAAAQPASAPTINTPIVEDNLECPLCGYIAKDESGLKTHKTKEHA